MGKGSVLVRVTIWSIADARFAPIKALEESLQAQKSAFTVKFSN